jgi:hypothetical protein
VDKAKEIFESVKAFCEKLTGGKAPWWVIPVGVVVILAIIL